MGFRTNKPIEDQVIVITGASSGIGLATARSAAERGAAVVMAARSPEIEQLASELRDRGGRAEAVVADVSREADVRWIADRAEARFGRIDTWINNAGWGMYGRAADVPMDAMRELFDTNFWGVVHGSRVAVERMRSSGGTLINVGSIESDRAVPLHSIYAASKHAVKGFTDGLRGEIEHNQLPIQVTLIKPAAIDTPFFAHAKNFVDAGEPAAPPPVYAPDAVAHALLDCAAHPRREVAVGGAGRVQAVAATLMPSLADRLLARGAFALQFRDEPRDESMRGVGRERGDHRGVVLERSAYAGLRTSSLGARLGIGAVAMMALLGLTRLATSRPQRRERPRMHRRAGPLARRDDRSRERPSPY